LLIFIITIVWFLSGWPQVWQKPAIPPGIKITRANPDIETLRPQTNGGLLAQTTNPEYAHDASGSTTQSDTEYDADASPEATFYNWPTAGQTYTALTLKVYYEAQAASNDIYEIEYSTDNTSGQCDSTTWTDLVSPTSAAAADQTLVSATLSNSQDLTKLCVRLNTDKKLGPDNKHVYIEDIRIEGEYTPAVISVIVSDGVVAYGIMPAGTSKSTLSTDLNDMQTATNDGNVIENLNINGQDGTGGGCTWTLSSTNGNDQYIHQFCNDTDNDCSSPPTNYTALTTSYQALKTGVAVSGTVDFQLRTTVPDPSSCFGQQSVDVTIQAVQG